MKSMRAHTRLVAVAVLAAHVVALGSIAQAAPLSRKKFGPAIDAPAGYQGQERCDPHVKPGVVAFRRIVMNAFPNTGEGYFTRACSVGGRSEHKDGRAWDWMVNANSKSDRRKVSALFDWLFEKDTRGRRYARARRLGIMYFIWNRRIWFPWEGWRPYSGSSPHRDHVHFSFSWDGAKKRTSFWHQKRTFVMGASAPPEAHGFWTVTGNGSVLNAGAAGHAGDLGSIFNKGGVAGIASTPEGDGYWLVKQAGKIQIFGDALRRGSFQGAGLVVDIVSAPQGQGYWIVAKAGRVEAFGSADHYGNETSDAEITAMASTPTGDGYWLVSKQGRVFPFGDAKKLGQLTTDPSNIVDVESHSASQGFWLVSRGGRVTAFGGAQFFGDARARDLKNPIVSIVGTPDGQGYWLVNSDGRALAFGNAGDLQPQYSSAIGRSPRTLAPADPAPTESTFVGRFLMDRAATE